MKISNHLRKRIVNALRQARLEVSATSSSNRVYPTGSIVGKHEDARHKEAMAFMDELREIADKLETVQEKS